MTENELQRNERLTVQEKARSIAAANQNSAVARLVNVVYFLFAILEILLTLRVILHMVGANPDNGFAGLIYIFSTPFVMMFANLLRNPAFGATAVLEVTTIIAMIVYAVAAWLVGRLIWLVLSRPR